MTTAASTVLITGATDGHGRALAERVALTGARVLLHGRDPARGNETQEHIQRSTDNDQVRYYNADFADLSQVMELARQIRAENDHLDVLVNNAGIGGFTGRQVSKQGHELRFAVNYLAGYLLTRELMPLLRSSAQTVGTTRVVSVSSIGQTPINFADIMLERSYDDFQAYAQSKLAQIMMTFDIAAEFRTTKVAATALHPATYMPTKMVTTPMSTIEDGVRATLRLVDQLPSDAINGKFFDADQESQANETAYDAESRRKLQMLSDELIAAPLL